MLRYQCPRCHEITHRDEATAFCGICCGPLTDDNVLADPQPQPQSGASLADLLSARDEARAAAKTAYSL